MKRILSAIFLEVLEVSICCLFLVYLFSDSTEYTKTAQVENNNLDKMEDTVTELFVEKEYEVLRTIEGILTGYGPDCVGCGNYTTNKVSTASGYHIADIVDGAIQPAFTVTYNDSEFGEVRIVAADKTIPYYSIVRINNIPNRDPIIAIVLDRGSTVGIEDCRSTSGCLTTFDLLFETEATSMGKTKNITFEILRLGE